MIRLRQIYKHFVLALALLLAFASTLSVAQAGTNNTATTQAEITAPVTGNPEAQKTTPKPQQKSLLDSEVLESPVAYFKHAFTPEKEDTSDTAASPGALVLALKALIATLLSTIM